jgi:hypothetical protein
MLFTGNGTAGSWKIRGEQLGGELGAMIQPHASFQHIVHSDLIVVVKRCPQKLLDALRQAKRKWIFDVVDFYPQPTAGAWSRDEAINWVRNQIKNMNPTAVLWPNRKMMEDCNDGRPAKVLYHHHRPGLPRHQVRQRVEKVAYEGSAKYLGRWQSDIEMACRARGWQFEVNPSCLSDADIVIAARDGIHNGYVQQHWKSNVKLANAQGAGVAFVAQKEDGYTETSAGEVGWFSSLSELQHQFDLLDSMTMRTMVHRGMLAKAYPVERAASDLLEFACGL